MRNITLVVLLLCSIAAAWSLGEIFGKCKPPGSYVYDMEEVESGIFCGCKTTAPMYECLEVGQEPRSIQFANDPLSIKGLSTNASHIKQRYGGKIVTHDGYRSLTLKGLYVIEGCCLYPNEGMIENTYQQAYAFISRYQISSPTIKMRFGVKIGMDRDRVRKIIGDTPHMTCPSMDAYVEECGGAFGQLTFKYNEGTLSEVIVQHIGD